MQTMRTSFEGPSSEGVILVGASNAFNSLKKSNFSQYSDSLSVVQQYSN